MGQIGRYETICQLGRGAMGTVYRARDTATDREVALKTIRTASDVPAETRERFYRETRACSRLQHPNIVRVLEVGESGNLAYIAMELLSGSDFQNFIQEKGSLPLDSMIAAVAGACDALAHAHRHGVIHRDLKPANLFLTNDGCTKVLDFGLARLPSTHSTITVQGPGTTNYMAPELILGRSSDGRADLFSLAVIFFQLLTGIHPYHGPYIPRRIAQGTPDSLLDHDPGFPPVLHRVLLRGLAKEPHNRYQTADEFALDLRTILEELRSGSPDTLAQTRLVSDRTAVPGLSESLVPEHGIRQPVPIGADPDEWRLSEALRLLPEFEVCVERGELEGAESTLAEVESSLGGDVRFCEALQMCRLRFQELACGASKGNWPESARAQSAGSPVRESRSISASGPVTEPTVNHPNPVLSFPEPAAIYAPSRSDGSTISGSNESSPVVSENDTGGTYHPDGFVEHSLYYQFVNKKLILTASIGLLILLTIILLTTALRPVRTTPAVASAQVRIGGAKLYAGPNERTNVIAVLGRTNRVNILRLPASQEQTWTLAQCVEPKVSRPGYIHTRDLRDWQGFDGSTALAIARMLADGASSSEDEIEKQIRQLADVISRFPGDPAANDARIDIVHLRLVLAQRMKVAGRPQGDWALQLAQAEDTLRSIHGEEELKKSIADFVQAITAVGPDSAVATELVHAGRTSSVPVAATPRVNVTALLAQATALRASGDYPAAKDVIQKILQVDPYNRAARTVLDKIKRAEDDEK